MKRKKEKKKKKMKEQWWMHVAEIKLNQLDALFGTNMQSKHMMEGHNKCQPLAKRSKVHEIIFAAVTSCLNKIILNFAYSPHLSIG